MSEHPEAATSESWRRTLASIPTVVGRLIYLASLRDPNSGGYMHAGLAQRLGDEETDRLLRRSHVAVFQEWLCFVLQKQTEEIDNYFSGLSGNQRETLISWIQLEPYRGWVPAESRDVERKLFITDLRAVLEIFRAEYGVASRDPES